MPAKKRRSSKPAVSSTAIDILTLGSLTRVIPRKVVEDVINKHNRMNKIGCKLPAPLVAYLVVSFGLKLESTREVLRWLLQGMKSLCGNDAIPADTAGKPAISMARARLGWEVLRDIYEACAQLIATPKTRGANYRNWRLMAIDGTTFATQDTPDNVKAFGKTGSKEGLSAFPLMRCTGLVEIGTHIVLAVALGAWRDSEVALAEKLLSKMDSKMLCLLDRGFVGYPFWKKVADTGAKVIGRMRINMKPPCEKRLPDGSYLATLYPTGTKKIKGCPGLRVRIIEYRLPHVPESEPLYRICTNILDPADGPADELAGLYHERWENESVFDEVKTHLRGGNLAVLRSLSADMVRQEIYGLFLAHYAIRCVMHEAALQIEEDPDRISFVHTIRVLRRSIPQAAALSPLGG
jgi:hypothetical protein